MKKITKIILGLLILVAVFVWVGLVKSPADQTDSVKIYFLNVGQGDSEMIEKGDYQILIDGGPDDSVLTEIGKIMPLTDRKIDVIVLTHPDSDHLTGIREILKRYQVGKIYFNNVNGDTNGYVEFKNKINPPAGGEKIEAVVPEVGENFAPFDNGKLTFLWPGKFYDGKDAPGGNTNNSSEVVKFCYFSNCALFTGDIQTDEQSKMFDYYSSKPSEASAEKPDSSLPPPAESNNNIFNVELLKIPHHGSINGTDQNLLDMVKPRFAIIEVGADNKYGHPHTANLNLLQKNNIQYFRTDRDGTIEFLFTQNGIIKK